ncbi:MAG: hypothetical protein ACP5DX_04885 [Paracoccaceae bacterium]
MRRVALCLLLLTSAAARADEAATVEGTDMTAPCMEPPASQEGVEVDAEHGAWYYRQACAMCHGPADMVRARIQGETEAERSAWLDVYLQHHHCAPDEAMRADLIAYLLQD